MEQEIKAKVGQIAPNFIMKTTGDLNAPNSIRCLNDSRGKWLLLFFYPLDFSTICPTELLALSDRLDEFEELDADILGISCDSINAHRAWLKISRAENGVAGLRFPLASDITKQVARDYGVLVEEEGIALRGLFIIDPDGILQYSVIHNMNVGRSVDETLRVLEALQAGGLCAADWQPGMEPL